MNFKNNFNGSIGVTSKNRSLIKKRAAPNFSDKRLTKPCVKDTLLEDEKNENVDKVRLSLVDSINSNVDATVDHKAVNNDNNLTPLPKFLVQNSSNLEKIENKIDDISKNSNDTSKGTDIGNTEGLENNLKSTLNNNEKDIGLTSDKSSNEITIKNTKNAQNEKCLNDKDQISDISDKLFDTVRSTSGVHVESDSVHNTAPEVQHCSKFIRRRAAPSVRSNKPKMPNPSSITAPSAPDTLSKTGFVRVEEVSHISGSLKNEQLHKSSESHFPPFEEAEELKNYPQPTKSKCLKKRAAPSLASKSTPSKKQRGVNLNSNGIKKRALPTVNNISDPTPTTEVEETMLNFSSEQKVEDSSNGALIQIHPDNKSNKESCVSLKPIDTCEQKSDINEKIHTDSQSENEQEKNVERVIRVFLNSWPKYPRSDPFSDEPDHDLRTIRECGSISIWKQNKYHIAVCDLMEPINLGKTPKNWTYIHLNKLIKEEVIDPDFELEQIDDQIVDIESSIEPNAIQENESNLHITENNEGINDSVHCLDSKESESDCNIPTSQTTNVLPSCDLEPKERTVPKIKREIIKSKIAEKPDDCPGHLADNEKNKSKTVEKSDVSLGNLVIDEKSKSKIVETPDGCPGSMIDKDDTLPINEEKMTEKMSKGLSELKKTRRSSRKRDKENISSSSSENVKKSPEVPKKKKKLKSNEKVPEVKANNNTVLSFGQMSSMIKSKWKTNGTPPDQAKLSLKDFIIYVPPSEPMKSEPQKNEDQEENETEECEMISEQSDVPKLIIRDGEIVVDPSSTMIKRTPLPIKNEGIEKYQKNNDTRDLWDISDTIKFYRTLWKYGIDFSMITSTFPDKSRIAIKRKFKFEQKHHTSLVDYVLSGRNVDFKSVMRQLIIISGNEAIRKKKLLKKESTKPVATTHFLGPSKKKTKRGRKPKKQQNPKEKLKKQAVLKKLFENDPSEGIDSSVAEIIIPDDINTIDLKDIITLSANLDYNGMKIVESVSFNPSNFVQPVDFNYTISHGPKHSKDPDCNKEEISSTSVIQL